MIDTMASQNIDLSSWDTLYISVWGNVTDVGLRFMLAEEGRVGAERIER
jgi:hypothetical protein